jgi:hypothetical protein
MAEYVNELPEGQDQGGVSAANASNEGLAGDMKDAGLVTKNKPAQEVTRNRPVGVAVAAMLMFAASAWMMPFVFILGGLNDIPPVALGAAIAVMTLFGVMSSMAMFMLKRWSVYAFTAVTIISNLIFFAVGAWQPIHLILPLVVLAVAYSQLKHLR